jgi:hypothetical protein
VARLGGRGERHGGRVDAQRPRRRGRHGRADRFEERSLGHGRAAYLTIAALTALLVLAAAACGGGGDDDRAGATTASVTGLTVTEYDGARLVRTTELACGPDDTVCAEVVALLPRLKPDPGEVCTQIYGGPESITVTGIVEGAPVTAVVTRTNGCEIARYDMLRKALAAG